MKTCKQRIFNTITFMGILAILAIIATACTPKRGETQIQTQPQTQPQTESEPTPVVRTEAPVVEVSYNYSKILNGDLSEFAGYWVNGHGTRIQLRADGVLLRDNGSFVDGETVVNFRRENNEYLASGDIYMWLINPDEMGHNVALYPVGVDVKAWSGTIPTDNTKVRITSGSDLFSQINSPADIFYWSGEAQATNTVGGGGNLVNSSGEAWGFSGGMGGHMGGNSGYIFNSDGTFQRLSGTFGEDTWELGVSGRYTTSGDTVTLIYDGEWGDGIHYFSVTGNRLVLDDFIFTIMKTADMNITGL